MATSAWHAYFENILTPVQMIALNAVTPPCSTLKPLLVNPIPTNTENGEALASNDIIKGDTVNYAFDGKVTGVASGWLDIEAKDGQALYGIDKARVTLVKKATPAEPGIGTVISFYGDKYLHTEKGWEYLNPRTGTANSIAGKWDVFADWSAVRVLTAGDFVTNR